MTRSVVLLTTLDEPDDRAVRQADRWARLLGCRLAVGVLAQRHSMGRTAARQPRPRGVIMSGDAHRRILAATGRRAGEVEVFRAPPAIEAELEARAPELVVVAAPHRRRWSRRAELAVRLLRSTTRPLLTVRAEPEAGPVLVATDLDHPGLPAIAAAIAVARLAQAPLAVLSALEPAWTSATPGAIRSPAASPEERLRLEQRLQGALAELGIPAQAVIPDGPAAPAIVGAASRLAAALVVIGNPRGGALRRAFHGGVAEAVVCAARCSVLAIPLGTDERPAWLGELAPTTGSWDCAPALG